MHYQDFFRQKYAAFQGLLVQEKDLLQKCSFRTRHLLILFSLAFCLGIASKAVAREIITIGHDDYLVTSNKETLDLNHLSLIPKANQSQLTGPICEE